MKKNILSLAALLIASATFVACSSDDNIIGEQPAKGQTYTMTINASKGGDTKTRALALDGKTLNATWATTENVYVQKGSDWATGSLQPQDDGATATLKGTLSGITIAENDVLTLQFPRSGARDYTGQVGTLADIAAKYDYATASVAVSSISATGNIIPEAATTTFTNQQAIVKFTLKDKDDAAISATELTVSDGTTDYSVAPASATGEIYVAIPGFSSKTVTLTATVGDDTYTYEKADVTFTNGQYYEITVKMEKEVAAPTAYTLAESTVGMIVGTDGNAYAVADKNNLPSGVTAVGMVAYKNGSNGLVIALANEGDGEWSIAKSACEGKTAVGGHSWHMPSLDEWKQMFKANGGSENSFKGLADAVKAAGGVIEYSGHYWTSTEDGTTQAYYVVNDFGDVLIDADRKNEEYDARPVLAF